MQITIHCGGMPFSGRSALTQSLGGSETSAYYLAKNLAHRGHRVTLFTTSRDEGVFEGVRYVHAGPVSEDYPLGERFHFYATATPSDVLVIQRHPGAFRHDWAAKIRLWWVHDLALRRSRDAVQHHLWNVDGVLAVSEFHRLQVIDTWGVNPRAVRVLPNGVDVDAPAVPISDEISEKIGDEPVRLFYGSRPERGLEYHLGSSGLMERLADDPSFHLYFCGYDNVTEKMRPYYESLWRRAESMGNVTNLGAIPREQMPAVMAQMHAVVYPSRFEETSCLLAMEAMQSGCAFIGSEVGALPETCDGSAASLLPLGADGEPDLDAFEREVRRLADPELRDDIGARQRQASRSHDWGHQAEIFERHVAELMSESQSDAAIARHLMRMSDISTLEWWLDQIDDEKSYGFANEIVDATVAEFQNYYAFLDTPEAIRDHYARVYDMELARHDVASAPEELADSTRGRQIAHLLHEHLSEPGGRILDYGCAHGALTHGLARRLPDHDFVGVDFVQRNIDQARALREQIGLENEAFFVGDICSDDAPELERFDAIVIGEVLEHVAEPISTFERIMERWAKPGALVLLTTPYGPWEAIKYRENQPLRMHLHHFERTDLHEIWGSYPNFRVFCVPGGETSCGDRVGCYITAFEWQPEAPIGTIDRARKIRETVPRGTVSLCMLVGHDADQLRRCLDSVPDVVDEVIIALDNADERTLQVIDEFEGKVAPMPIVRTFEADSPLEIGFDEARNRTIDMASGDWVLWMDADEFLVHQEKLPKYLYRNAYEGFAMQQRHLSADPPGLLKTDLPVRLFRTGRDVRFFGVVHEHPETALNEGVGHVLVIPDVDIIHDGYTSEPVRRGRFERNLELVARDRERYPERRLGKMLWLRDLAQMCRYELERNGGTVTEDMRARAAMGVQLWLDLLDAGEIRMASEALQWYTQLVRLRGEGFDLGFCMHGSPGYNGVNLEGAQELVGTFVSRDHARKFLQAKLDDLTDGFESPYQ